MSYTALICSEFFIHLSFCEDYDCWFALTSKFFVVNDNLMRQIVLQGPNKNGLYPIKFANSASKTVMLPSLEFLLILHLAPST